MLKVLNSVKATLMMFLVLVMFMIMALAPVIGFADDGTVTTTATDWTAKITLVTTILLALHTFLKAVRDAIDTTPETDDNWFEKLMTFLGKVANYFAGKRST